MEIEEIVEYPTWREMLISLVENEQLDPWGIDIVAVTQKYIEKIRRMTQLELRVPANVILAAAILLRMKAEILKFEEQVVEQEVYIEELAPAQIPMLQLSYRIPPVRTVTLRDLLEAIAEVMEIEQRRAQRAVESKKIEIQIPELDITQEMSRMFRLAVSIRDGEGWLTFTQLLKALRRYKDFKGKSSSEQIALVLIPLLHLAQNGKVVLLQEKYFGEIFIKVANGGKR